MHSLPFFVTLRGQMGAAELVLKAMRNLVEHPELQASACGAIFVLTFAGADMQDSLAALGAGDLIITVSTQMRSDYGRTQERFRRASQFPLQVSMRS